MAIDFVTLEDWLTRRFVCGITSIHGPSHWKRVERNGLLICRESTADEEVVRLFALLHDSCRENDGFDTEHGPRAADLAVSLRGRFFDLDDEAFARLEHACRDHTRGHTSSDPTVGACWDADRLDLGRVGIIPARRYMSTEAGRALLASRLSKGPLLR